MTQNSSPAPARNVFFKPFTAHRTLLGAVALACLITPAGSFSQTPDPAPSAEVIELQQLASEGDAKAKYQLAEAYRKGEGVAPDPTRSIALFEELAETGNANAYQRLGDFYARGNGVPPDMPRAIGYYKQAIDAGSSYANISLGLALISTGEGEAALSAFQQALEDGQKSAALEIALGHAAGSFGAATDPQSGIPVLAELAQAGDDKAKYSLAEAYRKGLGTAPDPARSIALFQELAETGNANAFQRLGDFYATGNGVPTDLQKAIEYYRSAVSAGSTYANIALGRALAKSGEGEAALAAFNQALDAGQSSAKLEIASGHAAGSFGAASDPQLGVPVLAELAAAGDDKAKYKLADAYRTGTGTAKDPQRSIALFQDLAETGNANAFQRLGDFYATGDGVPEDLEKAIANYRAAIEAGSVYANISLGRALIKNSQGKAALDAFKEAVEGGSTSVALDIAVGHAAGSFGDISDPALGVPVLEQLSQAGDENAKYKLAEALRTGTGTPQDLPRSAELFQELAELGNRNAYQRLGDFYNRGTGVAIDKEKAIDYYSKAAAAGSGYANILLGRTLADTDQGEAALAAFVAAEQSGQKSAELEIAAGHANGVFGSQTNPDLGIPVLEKLAVNGNAAAALKLLRFLENDPNLEINVEEILKSAHVASLFGDSNATAGLVRFYRMQPNLAENALEQRQTLLDNRGDSMRPARYVDERLYLIHDTLPQAEAFREMQAVLQSAPSDVYANGLLRIRNLDQNAYVFVLQGELSQLGYLDGQTNGQLNSRTVRSIAAFCADKDIAKICAMGPLRGTSAKAIGIALAEGKP
ncbi:MAG: tetratricopeptide repeat protein [Marinosulfonomonas sp.]